MTEKIKIMLSRPMKGKTREEIEEEEKEMVNLLFDKYEDNCEIISSVIENPEEKSELECFSESIFFMSMADVLAMGFGWENARGCRLEYNIAKAYGVHIIYLDEPNKTKNRFYIDDEHIHDNLNILEPIWIETYSQAKEVCNEFNRLHDRSDLLKEVMDGDAQYRLDTAEQLKKHYNYAIQQMNENIDDVMVYKAYDVLRASIKDIAEELGVELE